ncbi:MAG: hypothetical protein RBS81_05065 [Tenuifilaceae bacterium]|jgi:uncharacterized membrane protein|nr:hypothetical protein [Tenuifilaceae bacterium]
MKSSSLDLKTIGRILFALPFGIIGINHFVMVDFFSGMLTSFVPGGGFSIILTGIFLIAASISIITNRLIRLSCFLLAALLFVFIVSIHIPQLFEPEMAKFAFMQLLKDTALLGGALLIASTHKDEKKKR